MLSISKRFNLGCRVANPPIKLTRPNNMTSTISLTGIENLYLRESDIIDITASFNSLPCVCPLMTGRGNSRQAATRDFFMPSDFGAEGVFSCRSPNHGCEPRLGHRSRHTNEAHRRRISLQPHLPQNWFTPGRSSCSEGPPVQYKPGRNTCQAMLSI